MIVGDDSVVRWGCSVYANIHKFIQFQLTFNVAALVINVVAAISSGDVPLNAVHGTSYNKYYVEKLACAGSLSNHSFLVLNFGGESILPKQDTKAHGFQVKNTRIFNAFVMCQIMNHDIDGDFRSLEDEATRR